MGYNQAIQRIYGGLYMPSVEPVKKDLEALNTTGQEKMLNYIEEVIALGSVATEVTNEVKENRFSRGKIRHPIYE